MSWRIGDAVGVEAAGRAGLRGECRDAHREQRRQKGQSEQEERGDLGAPAAADAVGRRQRAAQEPEATAARPSRGPS